MQFWHYKNFIGLFVSILIRYSMKVDFLVKVCNGDSYISELGYQVRVNYATILAVGRSLSGY
jgi:hypothetical protein